MNVSFAFSHNFGTDRALRFLDSAREAFDHFPASSNLAFQPSIFIETQLNFKLWNIYHHRETCAFEECVHDLPQEWHD